MTKTKITIISIILILTLLGIGVLTFVLFQPKNSTILESPKQPTKSIQSYSSSNKQSKFEKPINNTVLLYNKQHQKASTKVFPKVEQKWGERDRKKKGEFFSKEQRFTAQI